MLTAREKEKSTSSNPAVMERSPSPLPCLSLPRPIPCSAPALLRLPGASTNWWWAGAACHWGTEPPRPYASPQLSDGSAVLPPALTQPATERDGVGPGFHLAPTEAALLIPQSGPRQAARPPAARTLRPCSAWRYQSAAR